jgi:spore germination cell wall hydrolase CwlJ-like protein
VKYRGFVFWVTFLLYGFFDFVCFGNETYTKKLIAAVLVGEAGGEGTKGMLAVGEVIHQRSVEWRLSPFKVVMQANGRFHAFSCLNDVGPEKLIKKHQNKKAYQAALHIAELVCDTPEKLPKITRQATHFAVKGFKPWWAGNHAPVVTIGNHSFYRLPNH